MTTYETVRDLVRDALASGHVVTQASSGLCLDEDDHEEDLEGFSEPGEIAEPGIEVLAPHGAACPDDAERYQPVWAVYAEDTDEPLYIVWSAEEEQ